MAKSEQEKAEPARCICGRKPCTVKHKGRHMVSCTAQDKCAMRSRWKSSEQEAVKDWNTAVNAARFQRGGKSLHRAIRIFLKAGTMSPSLRRRVKISDIWRTPWYGG